MKIQTIKTKTLLWINIEKPTIKKLRELQKEFSLHPLDIDDVLTYTQRPKIETYPNYLFVIIRFPIYVRKERKFIIGEIDLFVGKNWLISIHRGRIEPILAFLEKCKLEKKSMEECLKNTNYLFYNILKSLFISCFPMLDHMAEDIDFIEDEIFKGHERAMVEEISIIKRNIIDFRRVIMPHREVLKALERIEYPEFIRRMKMYFSDILDFVEKIWLVLESQKETIDALESTNEALIAYKTGTIIKVLTVFSAILLPLTLIASIFGMNIERMPFVFHPQAFWIIMGLMFIIILGMLAYFKKKEWI